MESQLIEEQTFGNYRRGALLGRGGFADVYLGEHIHLHTPVALKVFRARLDDESMQRFLDHAGRLARLHHPRLVRILEFFTWDGQPVLVMQYAPGGTLRWRYCAGSRLEPAVIVKYVRQAADVLDTIHRAGYCHGDVKPENMLLDERDEMLLGDFGLETALPQNRAAHAAGTATYMAPEQARGHLCSASDQYALAVVVYEWLCGQPPFSGTLSEVAVQHALIEPPPLLTQRPELPPAVEQVAQRALAKEPGQRFPGILAFAGALEEALGQPTSPGEYGGDLRTAPVSRRRLLLGLGGAGVLALGGGLAWFALSRHAGTPARPAAIPAATQPLFIYTGHRAPLTSVAWSPDGTRVASADAAGGVQIWQARDEGHTPIGTLLTIHEPFETHTYLISAPSPPTPAVNTLAWAPSAQQIALGLNQVDPQEIRIWDLASNQDVQTFIASFLGACVAWSPDGTRVAGASYTGSYACSVDIWRLDTGNLIATLTYPEPNDGTYHALDNLPLGVSWSPDGGSIAGGSGRIIQLWSAQNGAFQQGLSLATGTSGTVAWSPNSRYIVSTGATYATAPGFVSPLVQVWDAQAGTLALTYRGHRATVNQAVWSPNGQYIASASDDHTVHVCNALTGTTPTVYRGHRGKVSGVSWSPDGRYIASASDDQTVHIWNSGLSS